MVGPRDLLVCIFVPIVGAIIVPFLGEDKHRAEKYFSLCFCFDIFHLQLVLCQLLLMVLLWYLH